MVGVTELKCPDSGECDRNYWPNLDRLKPTDQIKFVIASRRDWDWAADTIRSRHHAPRFPRDATTAIDSVIRATPATTVPRIQTVAFTSAG